MAAACLASFAILAGGLAASYMDWIDIKIESRIEESARNVEDYNNTKEPLAEQLA